MDVRSTAVDACRRNGKGAMGLGRRIPMRAGELEGPCLGWRDTEESF